MNRDDIIRMAHEAGFDVEVEDIFNYKPQHSFIGNDENMERFAQLIVRECAGVGYDASYFECALNVSNKILEHFGVK